MMGQTICSTIFSQQSTEIDVDLNSLALLAGRTGFLQHLFLFYQQLIHGFYKTFELIAVGCFFDNNLGGLRKKHTGASSQPVSPEGGGICFGLCSDCQVSCRHLGVQSRANAVSSERHRAVVCAWSGRGPGLMFLACAAQVTLVLLMGSCFPFLHSSLVQTG